MQISVAIITYCLVDIDQHDMRLERSTYEVLQILSISLTDKMTSETCSIRLISTMSKINLVPSAFRGYLVNINSSHFNGTNEITYIYFLSPLVLVRIYIQFLPICRTLYREYRRVA